MDVLLAIQRRLTTVEEQVQELLRTTTELAESLRQWREQQQPWQ